MISGYLKGFADYEKVEEVRKQLWAKSGKGLKKIFEVARLSWGSRLEEMRSFQFQVCGRLLSLRKSNAIVDAYFKSVLKETPEAVLATCKSILS